MRKISNKVALDSLCLIQAFSDVFPALEDSGFAGKFRFLEILSF